MSPKTGRPPADNPKIARIDIRVTPEEKNKIMNFSKKYKITILDLIMKGIDAVMKEK